MARSRTNETLNFQIDKLSEAIQSMMKGFETLQTPRILDGEMIRIKPNNSIHVGLTGDDDISEPDSFYKGTDDNDDDTERAELHLDRLTMVAEDFRSFESRKIENNENLPTNPNNLCKLLELICNKINDHYSISLPFTSLEDFISSFHTIIEKSIICSIVDLHSFLINLSLLIQNEQPSTQQLHLGDTILNIAIKERPRKRFQKPDYSCVYDSTIEKLFESQDLPEEIKSIGKLKKNLLVSIDLETIKNKNIDELREDLQSQIIEAEILKKKLQSQIDSLTKFSKQLRQKDIELIKLQETIEETKRQLEDERQGLVYRETKHNELINNIKLRISEICPDMTIVSDMKPRISIETSSTGRLSPLVSSIRTSTPVIFMSSPEIISDELSALQQELVLLESLPQDSSTLLKITRLKTQISTVRSATAINNSLRNSTNSISRIHNDHKRSPSNPLNEGPTSPFVLPRSGCSSPIGPENPCNQSFLKRTISKPPVNCIRKSIQKTKENDIPEEFEIIRNQLKVQECRLKEREELVEEQENRLKRTWMRVPKGEELISIVQKERNYLALIKKDYEDKYEELNAELIIFAKKMNQLKAREKEMENKIIEVGKEKKLMEDERKGFEVQYEAILVMLESL
ncbi:hypothetical protein SteCoe_25193 [Stentor coeruleus]|uniref:Uncharacterized protein n=1 Tax=Stentor coeruleus TaxID=5963 RepID=A0A1R2BG75_9CILI|nr:hypothetical protein SteCoe_25193 [Stentor coeruleus]